MLSVTYQKRFRNCRCLSGFEHLTVKTKKISLNKYQATITCDVCGDTETVIGFNTQDAITRLVQVWNNKIFNQKSNAKQQELAAEKLKVNKEIKKASHCACGCAEFNKNSKKVGAGLFKATAICTKCNSKAEGTGSTRLEAEKEAVTNLCNKPVELEESLVVDKKPIEPSEPFVTQSCLDESIKLLNKQIECLTKTIESQQEILIKQREAIERQNTLTLNFIQRFVAFSHILFKYKEHEVTGEEIGPRYTGDISDQPNF